MVETRKSLVRFALQFSEVSHTLEGGDVLSFRDCVRVDLLRTSPRTAGCSRVKENVMLVVDVPLLRARRSFPCGNQVCI